MIHDLFPKILFGLLAGDYILQTEKMAIKKSEKSIEGILYCLLHCSIVTLVSMLFLQTRSFSIGYLIFISHLLIDRYSIALYWLRFIGGRDFLYEHYSVHSFKDVRLAFSCIVYTVVDNTLHLLILYYGISFLL